MWPWCAAGIWVLHPGRVEVAWRGPGEGMESSKQLCCIGRAWRSWLQGQESSRYQGEVSALGRCRVKRDARWSKGTNVGPLLKTAGYVGAKR